MMKFVFATFAATAQVASASLVLVRDAPKKTDVHSNFLVGLGQWQKYPIFLVQKLKNMSKNVDFGPKTDPQ